MPLYASEQYEDPRAPAAAQDAAAVKARTGSSTPNFDPAAPLPATYDVDQTKQTSLNPNGINTNTLPNNYSASPSSIVKPIASTQASNDGISRPIAATPPPTVAPPPARPTSFGATTVPASTSAPDAPPASTGVTPAPIPGAGSATVNGRAISPAEIDRLSTTNVIPAASFTNPGIGTIGVPVSSSDGARLATNAITRPTPSVDVASAIQDAQNRARSDTLDILNRDPRSALGGTAHNLEADLIWNTNVGRGGRAAVGQYQNGMNALMSRATAPATAAEAVGMETLRANNAAALEAQRQEGDNQRAQLNAETQRQDAWLRRPEPKLIDRADGTMWTMGADNIPRPVLTSDGTPFRSSKAPDIETAKMTQQRQEEIAKTATKLMTDSIGSEKLTPIQARARAYEIHGMVPPQDEWVNSMKAVGSKLSNDQLVQAYKERYGN